MNRMGKKTQSSNAKHLITIRYRIMVTDKEGGFTQSWYERVGLWGEIATISASQKFEYNSINVNASHVIKINGTLDFQDNTKKVNDIWTITYSGVTGTDVKIEYQIGLNPLVEISASESNTGSYDWLIPIAAIGKLVTVKVSDVADSTSYYITPAFNIVSENARDGLPDEYDSIACTINGIEREFEILTVENLQEINEQVIITCLERRD